MQLKSVEEITLSKTLSQNRTFTHAEGSKNPMEAKTTSTTPRYNSQSIHNLRSELNSSTSEDTLHGFLYEKIQWKAKENKIEQAWDFMPRQTWAKDLQKYKHQILD